MASLFVNFPLVLLCAFLAAAAIFDLKSRKIPNWVVMVGGCIAVALVILGELSLKASAIGFLIGFGVFFTLYVSGVVGAGDVKMMGVSGMIVGFPDIIIFLYLACLISSVISIVYMIMTGRGRLLLRDLLRVFRPVAKYFKPSAGDPAVGDVDDEGEMVRMPFAPGVFLASLYFYSTKISVFQVYG